MKTMILTLVAAGALAAPAWAQDAQTEVDQPELGNITCEGFAAMDEAGQTTTFEALVASLAADDDAAADDTADASTETGGAASTDVATTDAASTDAATTDTADAASTDATSTEMASTDTADAASTDPASADAASTDAAGDMDPMMAAVLEACAADPMQVVADVMTQVGTGEGSSGN